MKNLSIIAVCLLLLGTSCNKEVSNVQSENNVFIDTTFKSDLGFDGVVKTINNLPNNDFLMGGSFITFDGYVSTRIAKSNSKGNYIPIISSSGFNGSVNCIVTQSNGKILVGGTFNLYEGVSANRIIRLNTDGSIDETFKAGQGFWGSGLYGAFGAVNSLALQSDGKILVGGDFTIYNGTKCGRIIRLNSDGSIDGSFPVPVGFNNTVNVIKIINEEFAYVGGAFTTYTDGDVNVIKAAKLVKISLADASLDYSFNTKNGFDSTIFTAEIQSDGKLLVGGAFSHYQTTNFSKIVRLNIDGSIDNSFTPSNGFNSTVYSILVDTYRNSIIVGGDFTQFNSINCNRIIKLNMDASIDKKWNYGTGFDNTVFTLSFDSKKNHILAGGAFGYFDKTKANKIAKLIL